MKSLFLFLNDHMTTVLWIYLAIMAMAFIYYFFIESMRIYKSRVRINKLLLSNDFYADLSNSKLKSLWEGYQKDLVDVPNCGKRTTMFASDYFNLQSVANSCKFNLRQLDAAAGILVGLGLLGTFFGLTIGVGSFNSTNTQQIQLSIESLLGGMSTAFATSLVGMILSILYTWCDKSRRNKLSKAIAALNTRLDNQYYIDDRTLDDINEEELSNKMYSMLENHLNQVENDLLVELEEGQKVPVSSVIRELYNESTEQTASLKSFRTDLASMISEKMSEVFSQLMEKFEELSKTVTAPASDMVEKVVGELKESLETAIEKLNDTVSASTKEQMALFVKQLNAIATVMDTLPDRIQKSTDEMENMINSIKNELENLVENTSETLSDVADTTKESIESIQKTTRISNHDILLNTQTQVGEIEKAMSSLGEKTNEIVESFQSGIDDISDVIESLTDNIEALPDVAETVDKQSEIAERNQSVIHSANEVLEEMKGIPSSFNTLNKDITNVSNTFTDSLREYNETVMSTTNKFLAAYTDQVTQVISRFNGTIKDFHEVLEELNNSFDELNKKLSNLDE